jgi:hypothetical protein
MIKLVEVKEIPKRRCGKHHLANFLDEFMKSDMKLAKIEYRDRDYVNVKSCYTCCYRAAKHSGFPIKVLLRGENVYLVKL